MVVSCPLPPPRKVPFIFRFIVSYLTRDAATREKLKTDALMFRND